MKEIELNGKNFHFIGIGGIGMSALAYILAKRGLTVSGSDLRLTHITERLQKVGITVFIGHQASNLKDFDPSYTQIILSSAIAPDNGEYAAALDLGCPVFHRSELLAALIADYYSIAVAGTHGKTTTSSLISYILLNAGLDPTVIIGGEVKAFEGNGRLGKSKFLVAEADESDGSLSQHAPKIGVVTNIELDHTDHYQNIDQVISTFQVFAGQCETLIGCIDCEQVRTKLKPTLSYSIKNPSADYLATDIVYEPSQTTAQVWENGILLGQMQLKLSGDHNVSNALAGIAVGRKLGLDFEVIVKGISTFEGAKRRFEYRGQAGGIIFIDDYAHHPSELLATLAAARLRVQQETNRRIVAIFQPHRYSRTLSFFPEFASAFKDADLVVITDIYSAGEINTANITSEQLAAEISLKVDNSQQQPRVFYQANLTNLTKFLPEILQPGDLALFLGAGNLNQIIPDVINLLVD